MAKGHFPRKEGGYEIPDTEPMAIPLKYQGYETMEQRLQRFIRVQLSQRAAEIAGAETFEESDDFEIDEDEGELLASPYEVKEAPPEFPSLETDAAPPLPPGTKDKPVDPPEPAPTPPSTTNT